MTNNDQLAATHRRIEELKKHLSLTNQDLYHDIQAWTLHQELIFLLKSLLLSGNLNEALDSKVEVDLWNFGFKNYIGTLQTMTKKSCKQQQSEVQATLRWFLDMTSGFYLMLMEELKLHTGRVEDQRNYNYVVQYCLVHLGDVARYRNRLQQAEHFYRRAIEWAPGSGQAYNQIALLESNRGNNLASVYFYIRSLALRNPFPAASSNLNKLLSRIQQQQSQKSSGSVKLNSKTFLSQFLCLTSLLHCGTSSIMASDICKGLCEALTSLIATEALSLWQMIEVITISIYFFESFDQVESRQIMSYFIAATLNSLLLPVYTKCVNRGKSFLDFFGLPVIKIILQWIVLKPSLLETRGFLSHLQIWPSLAKVLNELDNLLINVVIEPQTLPEDMALRCFLPLESLEEVARTDIKVKTDESSAHFVRASRIVALGEKLVSTSLAGKHVIRKDNYSEFSFTAVDQTDDQKLVQKLKQMDFKDESCLLKSNSDKLWRPTLTPPVTVPKQVNILQTCSQDSAVSGSMSQDSQRANSSLLKADYSVPPPALLLPSPPTSILYPEFAVPLEFPISSSFASPSPLLRRLLENRGVGTVHSFPNEFPPKPPPPPF